MELPGHGKTPLKTHFKKQTRKDGRWSLARRASGSEQPGDATEPMLPNRLKRLSAGEAAAKLTWANHRAFFSHISLPDRAASRDANSIAEMIVEDLAMPIP